ncbi:hypothetical protein BD414DRAFT_158976 [Trametes punicea]|nr:hypothetical protein BD414DRAFT_158976 [Trametes punicea]
MPPSMTTDPSYASVKIESASTMPPPSNLPSHDACHHIQGIHLNGGLRPQTSNVSTPNASSKVPLGTNTPSSGLQKPMHTPAGRSAQISGGDRTGKNVAHRHAARLKQIQEAQEAQRREELEAARLRAQPVVEHINGGPGPGDRRVSFAASIVEAKQLSASGSGSDLGSHTAAGSGLEVQHQPRVSPPQVTLGSSDTVQDVDVDEYHFPSEDDAFLASLDLDALDEGIGRPIDFDEGAKPDVDESVDVSLGEESGAGAGANAQFGGRDVPHMQQTNACPQKHRADPGLSPTSASTTAAAPPQAEHANHRAPSAYQGSTATGERARTTSAGFAFASGAGRVSADALQHAYGREVLTPRCFPAKRGGIQCCWRRAASSIFIRSRHTRERPPW